MFRSLRYRDYRLFFAGQMISFTGSWMQLTAQSWLVYALTRDPFQLGLVGFLNRVPILLLGSLGGVLADRAPRRSLILLTQTLSLVQAAVLAAVTLSNRVQIWHIYALAAAIGLVNAFDFPARQVFVGELVPEDDRHNAIALNASLVNSSRVVGPAAAGLIIAAWGEGACFLINALSFLAVLAALAAIETNPAPARRASGGAWSDIRRAFVYVLRGRALRLIFALLIVVSLLGMPFIVLMPIFAEEVLGAGSRGLGILMASSGAGATVGSLILARRQSSAGLETLLVRMTLLFGAGLIGFAYSRTLWLSCALLMVTGIGMIVQLAGVNSLLQELAPERLRGRVMGFYLVGLMGIAPLGSVLAGAAARRIGAPHTVALGAAAVMLAGLACRRRLPARIGEHRRRLARGRPALPALGPDLGS